MKYALCLLLTALLSYLWGSLNSAIIVIRLLKHEDIRDRGSGNAGLTNVLRVYGKTPALITLICDLFKGVAAVLAARLIVSGLLDIVFFNDRIFIGYVAGLFVMLGHIFPVFYGFHGGKGVLLAATTLIAMDPLTCLLSLSVFAIVLAATKYVSVGSISAAAAYPIFTFITQMIRHTEGRLMNTLLALVIGLLIIYMHKPNILRLKAGTENKFGKKNKKTADSDKP